MSPPRLRAGGVGGRGLGLLVPLLCSRLAHGTVAGGAKPVLSGPSRDPLARAWYDVATPALGSGDSLVPKPRSLADRLGHPGPTTSAV